MLDAWTNIIKITDPEQLRLRFVEKSDYLCPLSRHMMIIIYSRYLLYNIKKRMSWLGHNMRHICCWIMVEHKIQGHVNLVLKKVGGKTQGGRERRRDN